MRATYTGKTLNWTLQLLKRVYSFKAVGLRMRYWYSESDMNQTLVVNELWRVSTIRRITTFEMFYLYGYH